MRITFGHFTLIKQIWCPSFLFIKSSVKVFSMYPWDIDVHFGCCVCIAREYTFTSVVACPLQKFNFPNYFLHEFVSTKYRSSSTFGPLLYVFVALMHLQNLLGPVGGLVLPKQYIQNACYWMSLSRDSSSRSKYIRMCFSWMRDRALSKKWLVSACLLMTLYKSLFFLFRFYFNNVLLEIDIYTYNVVGDNISVKIKMKFLK